MPDAKGNATEAECKKLEDRGWTTSAVDKWRCEKIGISGRSAGEALCIQYHIDAQERHGWRAGNRAAGGEGKQPRGYPYAHLMVEQPDA